MDFTTKINRDLINALKVYKKMRPYDIEEKFPKAFVGCLQSMLVYFPTGHIVLLLAPLEIQNQFIDKFEEALKNDQYDQLDNITLDFISNLKYRTPDFEISLNIEEDEKQKFIDICNNFKDKEWDEIIDEFIDSVYNLLSNCTIYGGQLLLGVKTWR